MKNNEQIILYIMISYLMILYKKIISGYNTEQNLKIETLEIIKYLKFHIS